MNTSATGGFLTVCPGLGRSSLEDILHDFIAGVAGLPGDLVRPRWQAAVPRVPAPGVGWCAFGIVGNRRIGLPVIAHAAAGDGQDEIVSTRELSVLVSFYGPESMDLAETLRDGSHLEQNRAFLRPHGLALTRASDITEVPEVVRAQWLARSDLLMVLQYETRRTCPTLNIVQVSGRVYAPGISVPTGCDSCPRACWLENTGE